jgi:GLPGLI family protein
MKKILIFSTSIMLFAVNINAQEIMDTSYIECTYEFIFMKDTMEKTKTVKDAAMILLIGNKYSKFYSYSRFIHDSAIYAMSEAAQMNMLKGEVNLTNFRQQYPLGESYKIYKNYTDNTLIFTDERLILMGKIQYLEPINKQNWKIYNETQIIHGYKCQKATCTFRGRNYIAWFTHEIPVSDGPWKFTGLPGLIIKVYDTKEHYNFELYSLRKVKKTITFTEQDYPYMTRDEYIKIYRNSIINPSVLFTGGTLTNSDGVIVKPKARLYDVMERDIK